MAQFGVCSGAIWSLQWRNLEFAMAQFAVAMANLEFHNKLFPSRVIEAEQKCIFPGLWCTERSKTSKLLVLNRLRVHSRRNVRQHRRAADNASIVGAKVPEFRRANSEAIQIHDYST